MVIEKRQIQQDVPFHLTKAFPSSNIPLNYFLQMSKTWDRGNRATREKILEEFVANNKNKTGPQLEREFGNGASLFLTRISAWLRLTYLLGYNISLQLQAISIFISAASGHRFLAEFLEVGGVLTVLELLTLPQIKESDKAEALRLLLHITHCGRKYKEFLCESYAVRAVSDCLARSRSEVTQDYCQNLLRQLGLGNPKYLMQVYKSLLSLLTSSSASPTAQQMVAQALRMLLPSIQLIHVSIVEATLSLLKSPHIQVQYEGYEILKNLVNRSNLKDPILTQLITILKLQVEDIVDEGAEADRRRKNQKANEGKTLTANQWTGGIVVQDDKPWDVMLSVFIQQAYAAKLLGVMAASSRELAERMIQLQVLSGLLNTIANVNHSDSQKYAASTMLYLVQTFDYVASSIQDHMGKNFLDLIEGKPDTFYKELTSEQVRYLRKNTVRVSATPERDGTLTDEDSAESGSSEGGSKPSTRATSGHRSARASTVMAAFPTKQKDEETPDNINNAFSETTPLQEVANQSKAQKEAIISEYEKMKDPNEEQLVHDLYQPYAHASTNTTFSGSKFQNSHGKTPEQFAQELDKFRSTNAKQMVPDEKEETDVEFDDQLDEAMVKAKTESFFKNKQHSQDE